MSDHSSIEWCSATWNVVTGCSRVSRGCEHCYAERLAATRLAHQPTYAGLATMTADGPRWTREVRFHADRLTMPLHWRKPRRVFVNAMSDLFHEGLTDAQIVAVFAVMAACRQHTFQVLTKRPERMRDLLSGWGNHLAASVTLKVAFRQALQSARRRDLGARLWCEEKPLPLWPLPNVWLGVSVEDQATADTRVPLLLECPAAVRWVSAEPLLGPVDLTGIDVGTGEVTLNALAGARPAWAPLDWVVVGGESGPGARPMHLDWARQIRDQCVAAGTAFFFKQHGEWRPLGALDLMEDADMTAILAADMERTIAVYPDGATDPEGAFGLGGYYVERVGKRRAGRLLDGRTWDEMPGGGS